MDLVAVRGQRKKEHVFFVANIFFRLVNSKLKQPTQTNTVFTLYLAPLYWGQHVTKVAL